MGGTEQLPRKPSRDNYAYGCDTIDEDELPDHLDGCKCEQHTGVCQNCGYKITVGPSGVEYGHARATNRRANDEGVRRDCIHRPLSCNPGEPHAWDGYGDEVATDGGRSVDTDTEQEESR